VPSPDVEAKIALETYSNYVRAWRLAVGPPPGGGAALDTSYFHVQENLISFRRLKSQARVTKGLKEAFLRGKLTLKMMESLPVEGLDDLAATANLWLPVQAYYAVEGMGIAALIAMGREPPKTHAKFLVLFSEVLVNYLPKPFNALCAGGPEPGDFDYTGINARPALVTAQNQLTSPRLVEGDLLLAKSLSMTRNRHLDELFRSERKNGLKPGQKRRNLKLAEKIEKTNRVKPTSIAHLLYRMRLRSNYDDPSMFVAGFDDGDGAIEHYRYLTELTAAMIEMLGAIVSRGVGAPAMQSLEDSFSLQHKTRNKTADDLPF